MDVSKESLQTVTIKVCLDFVFYLKYDYIPSLPLEMWQHVLLQCPNMKTTLQLLKAHSQLQQLISSQPYYTELLSRHMTFEYCSQRSHKVYVGNYDFMYVHRKYRKGAGFRATFSRCNKVHYACHDGFHTTLQVHGEVGTIHHLPKDVPDQEFMLIQSFVLKMVDFYKLTKDESYFDLATLKTFIVKEYPFHQLLPLNKLFNLLRFKEHTHD